MSERVNIDPRLTPYTDAAPPGEPAIIVVLGGAIKAWWEECPRCEGTGNHVDDPCSLCVTCNGRGELYGGPRHLAYKDWREAVRRKLIEERFLTYAPHEAFKGTWDERAQVINDAAIATADVFLKLSDEDIPSRGTDDEIRIAREAGTAVGFAPPGYDLDRLPDDLRWMAKVSRGFKRG